MIMAVTTLGVVGASLASAQTATVSNTGTTNTKIGFMQTLTDAQKTILEQARTLMKAGKKDEAKTLLSANGITSPQGRGHGGLGKGMGKGNGDRKAIEDAIIAGNYTTFQTVASTSPLKSISLATFNLLTPQFVAKKNAEAQIKSILTSAGITVPEPGSAKASQ